MSVLSFFGRGVGVALFGQFCCAPRCWQLNGMVLCREIAGGCKFSARGVLWRCLALLAGGVLSSWVFAQSAGLVLQTADVAENGEVLPVIVSFSPALQPTEEVRINVDDRQIARLVVQRGLVTRWIVRAKLTSPMTRISAMRVQSDQLVAKQNRTVKVENVAVPANPSPLQGNENRRVVFGSEGAFRMLLEAPEDISGTMSIDDEACSVRISSAGGLSRNPYIELQGCVQSAQATVRLDGGPVRASTPIAPSRTVKDDAPARGRAISLN